MLARRALTAVSRVGFSAIGALEVVFASSCVPRPGFKVSLLDLTLILRFATFPFNVVMFPHKLDFYLIWLVKS